MLNIDFENKEALLQAFSTEQKCIDYLEALRWDGVVSSPFDEVSKVYYCTKNTYKCRNSGKYFNVKTGTLFHNTKIELQKWFVAIWIVSLQNNRINSVTMSKELGITQKTAWYMIKRIKVYLNRKDDTFEKKSNLTLANNIALQINTSEVGVNEEKEKLPLLQWLQLLKK
jgi:transposase-like protein